MKNHKSAIFMATLLFCLAATNCIAECNIQKGDIIENKDGSLWAVTRVDDVLIYFRHYPGGLEDVMFSDWIKKGHARVHTYGTEQYCEKAAAFLK